MALEFLEGPALEGLDDMRVGGVGKHDVAAFVQELRLGEVADLDLAADVLGTLAPLELDDLDAELPQLTQITLGISFWLRENILWLLPALVIGVVALRSWIDTDAGRETFDRVRLRLPLVGAIFHQFALSEFCRSLATLLAGGLPLMQAFEIAVDAISNRHVGGRIRPAIDKVRKGRAFNQALDEAEVFPPITLDMIKVGETTGSLDEMLANVSDYLDEKVEVRLQRLLALLEPVLLVIMGGLIALILISVYLPMLKAFGQVGR